jgi:hypothetical protein
MDAIVTLVPRHSARVSMGYVELGQRRSAAALAGRHDAESAVGLQHHGRDQLQTAEARATDGLMQTLRGDPLVGQRGREDLPVHQQHRRC